MKCWNKHFHFNGSDYFGGTMLHTNSVSSLTIFFVRSTFNKQLNSYYKYLISFLTIGPRILYLKLSGPNREQLNLPKCEYFFRSFMGSSCLNFTDSVSPDVVSLEKRPTLVVKMAVLFLKGRLRQSSQRGDSITTNGDRTSKYRPFCRYFIYYENFRFSAHVCRWL